MGSHIVFRGADSARHPGRGDRADDSDYGVTGLSNKFDKHKQIAKITLPLWLYVSVTGVIVYLMLYQM